MIVPKTLVFSEQSFASEGYYVELCGEKLLFSTDYPPFWQLKSLLNEEQDDESDDQAYTIPSEAEWKAFRETLDKINFWRWKREYVDTGILDGVQVEITIEYEKKKLKAYRSRFGLTTLCGVAMNRPLLHLLRNSPVFTTIPPRKGSTCIHFPDGDITSRPGTSIRGKYVIEL